MKTRRSKGALKRQATKLLLGLAVWLVVCVVACASCALGETTVDGASGDAVRIRKLPPAPRLAEEGFKVRKIGSRYEPMVDFDPSVFRLPGTQMTFAEYTYHPPGEDIGAEYGFLADDGRFLYVDEVERVGRRCPLCTRRRLLHSRWVRLRLLGA